MLGLLLGLLVGLLLGSLLGLLIGSLLGSQTNGHRTAGKTRSDKIFCSLKQCSLLDGAPRRSASKRQ